MYCHRNNNLICTNFVTVYITAQPHITYRRRRWRNRSLSSFLSVPLPRGSLWLFSFGFSNNSFQLFQFFIFHPEFILHLQLFSCHSTLLQIINGNTHPNSITPNKCIRLLKHYSLKTTVLQFFLREILHTAHEFQGQRKECTALATTVTTTRPR